MLVLRPEGTLLYPNDNVVSDRVLALTAGRQTAPRIVVLDLELSPDLDVQSADMLAELAQQLAGAGVELRLAAVHAPARGVLHRSGLPEDVPISATIDEAVG